MKPIISIVSGTYNRLPLLRSMVESVRKSVTVIPYEIIIVDGGSTDGSIEWCKDQEDIALIEQGELLGAIKAFNTGAMAARGDYTILANDDIIFIDESITCAFAYMQDNPICGIGCFWQDRDGKNWHVEQMPAISSTGKQIHVYYGQVCIIPTWLGNYVGWWGDYNHTYGGDNEMSCNVHELGYAVSPLPCACIHDKSMGVNDELRKRNNQGAGSPAELHRLGKPHPDSIRWRDKWTQGRLVGPRIASRTIPTVDVVEVPRYHRILYAPIYEPGHPIQKLQKRGLREALQKYGIVYEYDYMSGDVTEFLDIAIKLKPTIILTQIQNVMPFTETVITYLRNENPNAHLINWNGDYHPDNLYNPRYMRMMAQFDMCGFVTTAISNEYARHNIKYFYWQIGYERSDADPLPYATPRHDVVFLGNGYSQDRNKLAGVLRSLKNVDVGLYGSWNTVYRPNGSTLYDFDAGQRLYRAAKLTISDSQWPSATGFVSNRLFQAMAAGGALMLQQWFDGLEELLELEDRQQLVVWYDHKDLVEKIYYYLDHDDERRAIATAGTAVVRTKHSFDARVKELFHAIDQ